MRAAATLPGLFQSGAKTACWLHYMILSLSLNSVHCLETSLLSILDSLPRGRRILHRLCRSCFIHSISFPLTESFVGKLPRGFTLIQQSGKLLQSFENHPWIDTGLIPPDTQLQLFARREHRPTLNNLRGTSPLSANSETTTSTIPHPFTGWLCFCSWILSLSMPLTTAQPPTLP